MSKIFYSLKEDDVRFILDSMGVKLDNFQFEKLIYCLIDNFDLLPWDEYFELHVKEFLNNGAGIVE